MAKVNNSVIGQVFNKLTILSEESTNKHYKRRVKCKCECGETKVVLLSSLKNGHTKSCGCRRVTAFRSVITKHGKSYSRIYGLWRGMIARCEYKKNISYNNYGGRGITVCDEWKDFEKFLEWSLKNNYADNLSIDRIDSNKNYEPNNCRWVPISEQGKNKRDSIYISIDNVKMTLKDYCYAFEISYTCAYKRYKKGILNAS